MSPDPFDPSFDAWVSTALGIRLPSATAGKRAEQPDDTRLASGWGALRSHWTTELDRLVAAIRSDPDFGTRPDARTVVANVRSAAQRVMQEMDAATKPGGERRLAATAALLDRDPILRALDDNGFAPITLVAATRALVVRRSS